MDSFVILSPKKPKKSSFSIDSILGNDSRTDEKLEKICNENSTVDPYSSSWNPYSDPYFGVSQILKVPAQRIMPPCGPITPHPALFAMNGHTPMAPYPWMDPTRRLCKCQVTFRKPNQHVLTNI